MQRYNDDLEADPEGKWVNFYTAHDHILFLIEEKKILMRRDTEHLLQIIDLENKVQKLEDFKDKIDAAGEYP